MSDAGAEAPTWLIYDTSDGRLGWCRLPDGIEVEGLVNAMPVTGDHVGPEQVLHWLQGSDTNWPGDRTADDPEIQDLWRKIRDLQAD